MRYLPQLKSGFNPAGSECSPWAVFSALGGLDESTISDNRLSLTLRITGEKNGGNKCNTMGLI